MRAGYSRACGSVMGGECGVVVLFEPRTRDLFRLGNDVDDVPGTATNVLAAQAKSLSAACCRLWQLFLK